MALSKRVDFLMDPEQYAALEALARSRRKATGENTTIGGLIRESVGEFLAKQITPVRRKKRQTP